MRWRSMPSLVCTTSLMNPSLRYCCRHCCHQPVETCNAHHANYCYYHRLQQWYQLLEFIQVQGYVNDDRRADGLWKGWQFRVGTWNVDSLTGRAGEVVEALLDRKVDMACIQETWGKGSVCKISGAKGKRYKLFWMEGEERLDGVGIFVAQKWVDSVDSVERHNKRVLNLRMVLDNGLLNVLMVYAPPPATQ